VAGLTLIVKATRLCNLRCTYCKDWRSGENHTMTFEVMARMIAAALSDPFYDSVDFVWHGGEPTLLPIEFYQKALLVQSRFNRPGVRIRNHIQTNGTRLTDDWIAFLQENEFAVGISLDGPGEINDRYRPKVTGAGSYDDVDRGINLLKSAGIPLSVLMVVDEHTLAMGPEPIFEFLLTCGVKNFSLNAARPENYPYAEPGTPVEHYVDPERMTAFLIRLCDRWIDHKDPEIYIRELSEIRRSLSGERPKVCLWAGGCVGSFFKVEPNGDVAFCGRFLGDPEYELGNVSEQSFSVLRESAKLQRVAAKNHQDLAAMQACPEFGICNGWCPHERYLSFRHNSSHSDQCCGLRELIGHMRTRLAEVGETDAAVANSL